MTDIRNQHPTGASGRMSAADLARALMAGVDHHDLGWGEQAAVRLLIAQGTWLRREELRAHVSVADADSGVTTAWISWDAVTGEPDQSPASSGELAVLRLACHLAGHLPEHPSDDWALGSILTRLDIISSLLASRAVAMAALGPAAIGSLS